MFIRLPKYAWVEFLDEEGNLVSTCCLSESLQLEVPIDKEIDIAKLQVMTDS